MRIIGGAHRGLVLADIGGDARLAHLRPTSDRAREGLFNLLLNGREAQAAGIAHVAGRRVLDLFAGTGALGLEALSRGAAHVTFVEENVLSRAVLRQNIERMRAMGATDVWRRDATRLGMNRQAPRDLVFLDPPHHHPGLGARALASAVTGGWLTPGAVVAWEEAGAEPVPPGFMLIDRRRYGEAVMTILRRA